MRARSRYERVCSRLFQPGLEPLEDRLLLSANLLTMARPSARDATAGRNDYRSRNVCAPSPEYQRQTYPRPHNPRASAVQTEPYGTAANRAYSMKNWDSPPSSGKRDPTPQDGDREAEEYAQPSGTDLTEGLDALLALAALTPHAPAGPDAARMLSASPTTPAPLPVMTAPSASAASAAIEAALLSELRGELLAFAGAARPGGAAPAGDAALVEPLSGSRAERERPLPEPDGPILLLAEGPEPAGLRPPPLLAGMVPFDLAALGKTVDQFFADLDRLATDAVGRPILPRLIPWLVTTGLAAAAWELARRQFRQQPAARPSRFPARKRLS